jgi:hypothetical protein
MEPRALQRHRGNAVILATACIALALWSTSCAGGGSTAVVAVSTAGFSLSSTTINFGNQGVGTAGAPLTATLTNVGSATLTFSSIQVTGANAGDFTLSNNCGSSLAASAQCTLGVTFAPSAAGTRTASVVFTDNAAGSPQSLDLTGTGTAPGVGLSATTLTFGSQLVGTSSPAQTLTLTNNGNAALSITSFAITGTNAADFAQTNTCGSSVAVGATCTISVTFKPSLVGTETASVTITDNASGSPQAVALSGMGTASAASLSETSLTFASQSVGTTSAAQTVTLSSTGSAALSITSIAITGTNASDFAQTNTCGSSVAASATCTISVTFTPTAGGSRTASVSITDNGSGSPQTITLSGTGAGPGASLSATSLSFGSQPIDTTGTAQTVGLTNSGNATLSITSVAITGSNAGDFTQTNTCGSSLVAGANCTIAVMFTPSVAALEAASLSITDNAGSSPQTVSLSGTGTHDVIVSWTGSSTSGVVGYNVYRGTSSGGENLSSPLNGSAPINGTTYADANVTAGSTYYYVVTAVGSGGVQSADSNEANATVPTS